jgi:hypothetical protein
MVQKNIRIGGIRSRVNDLPTPSYSKAYRN